MELHTFMKWLTCSLFAMCIGIAGYAFLFYNTQGLSARVISGPDSFASTPWVTINPNQVESGATIPADTNVVFILPSGTGTILREVLLGWHGKEIRYWGYCFPDNYDPATASMTYGFPGKLFLSEREREVRKMTVDAQQPIYSILRPPTRGDIRARNEGTTFSPLIRHQLEQFPGGATCYIMTERPLPIGTDRDNDSLNVPLERFQKTNPGNPDTDGDGINDGLEVLSLHTDPIQRDTDGDGLIDGIEDINHNGKVDAGETDPTNSDSDHDNLCDGLCNIRNGTVCPTTVGKPTCIAAPLRGEDRNLNGKVDTGETDPLRADSDGDGILDEQEYFNCILLNKDPSKC